MAPWYGTVGVVLGGAMMYACWLWAFGLWPFHRRTPGWHEPVYRMLVATKLVAPIERFARWLSRRLPPA